MIEPTQPAIAKPETKAPPPPETHKVRDFLIDLAIALFACNATFWLGFVVATLRGGH